MMNVHPFELRLAYKFSRDPAEENQRDQNFPGIDIPVRRHRKVIANHDKNDRNRHERVVFGAQLG